MADRQLNRRSKFRFDLPTILILYETLKAIPECRVQNLGWWAPDKDMSQLVFHLNLAKDEFATIYDEDAAMLIESGVRRWMIEKGYLLSTYRITKDLVVAKIKHPFQLQAQEQLMVVAICRLAMMAKAEEEKKKA